MIYMYISYACIYTHIHTHACTICMYAYICMCVHVYISYIYVIKLGSNNSLLRAIDYLSNLIVPNMGNLFLVVEQGILRDTQINRGYCCYLAVFQET